MKTVPGAVPAAALLSYSHLSGMAEGNVAIAAPQGPPCSPLSPPAGAPRGYRLDTGYGSAPGRRGAALWPPAWQVGGGQHTPPGTVGKARPRAEETRVKSPWSSTAAQNLQAGGIGDVERGAVLQARILVHLLVTVEVLCPQSSTTFFY